MSEIKLTKIELQVTDKKYTYVPPIIRPWVPYEYPEFWRTNDSTLQLNTRRDYYV